MLVHRLKPHHLIDRSAMELSELFGTYYNFHFYAETFIEKAETYTKYSRVECCYIACRSVTDPRTGKRVALKKMPNIFKNITSAKRAFRELKMLCCFEHDNVSSV